MWDLVLPLILGGGFIGSLVLLLQYLNTRKGVRGKSDADAYTVYSTFITGVLAQAKAVNEDQAALLTARAVIIANLVDLVQELILFARGRGASVEDTDPYQDRLDELRRL